MEFIFEKASKSDITVLVQLVEDVWKGMEHKEWFALYDDVDKYINDSIDIGKGFVYKAVDASTGRIAGICVVTYPGDDSENLGYDIALPESELSQVAHMDTIVVHPLYRGNGLQQKLISLAEQKVLSEGFRYLMCTIHPDNIYSKENMEECGYKVVKETIKYGGMPRLVLLKESGSA